MGPATATVEGVRRLVEAGMDVARLNFSHGTHDEHAKAYALIRDASDASGHAVAILADLQGPKIRLGKFADGPVEWKKGETVTITTRSVEGTHDRVSTTYTRLAEETSVGNRLLIDDGRIELEVVEVEGHEIHCQVIEGGVVSDAKGISLPEADVRTSPMSPKDRNDLRYALELGVDLVALSFVRSPDDVKLVHELMEKAGRRVPVLAKIEKPQAVACLDAIIEAFDGLMIARGDLGVEMPLEEVPLVQKRAVQRCRDRAKPVIVATQMLDSMIQSPRPTRAEASDVANAVLDGADALMLSGETSVGAFPIESVETMARIIMAIEGSDRHAPSLDHEPRTRSGAIAAAAVRIGETLHVKAVVAFTQTGDTARRLARHHPSLPILAFTPEPEVRSQLALSWGVETFLVPPVRQTDEMVRTVEGALLDIGRFEVGESVLIVAGSPPGVAGSTNALRVHRLGAVITA